MIAEHLPQKAAGFVVERDQRLQAVGQRLDFADGFERSETRLVGRMIFEGLPVDARESHGPCRRACRNPGRVLSPSHPRWIISVTKRRIAKRSRNGSFGDGFVEILRDVLPDVEPDDVEQTVTGAFGKPDQRPGERVDLFDGEVVLDGQPLHRGTEKCADAIGDEVRRILAGNDALAQMAIAEIGDEGEDSGRVSGPGITSTRCR